MHAWDLFHQEEESGTYTLRNADERQAKQRESLRWNVDEQIQQESGSALYVSSPNKAIAEKM